MKQASGALNWLDIGSQCPPPTHTHTQIGYDLLDPGREVRVLEDLPRVAVQEDEEGGLHVRNLSLHRTANEEEALNLVGRRQGGVCQSAGR